MHKYYLLILANEEKKPPCRKKTALGKIVVDEVGEWSYGSCS